MELRELKIKHFGKFTDQNIILSEGVNLFYGENEAGKSTIFSFIKAMLFGMERGRGRASLNDEFSLYEPWENGNYYSGLLRFTSGGKNFCLERNFDKYSKGASLICEDDGEEFSLDHGDLQMLLGSLGKAGYDNTIAVGQLKIETEKSLAAELRNYAANYYAAGNSEIDLEKALQILNGKKKEADKAVKKIQLNQQEKRGKIEQEAAYVWKEILVLQTESESINQEILSRRKKDAEETNKVLPEIAADEKKWRVHPAAMILMITALILCFVILKQPWNFLVAIVILLAELLYIWNKVKDGKKKPVTLDKQFEELKYDEEQVSLQKLEWEQEKIKGSLKDKQTQYENLEEQLRELDELSDDYKEEDRKKAVIEAAVMHLTSLAGEIQKDIGEKLNQKASQILAAITDGKYSKIFIDENLDIHLLAENKKISVNQVSRGTLEQVYFALRLGAGEILYDEEFPVILDDTFAYYDDVRLENTLKWLVQNRRQVLIFTCHKREAEVLEQNKIKYRQCL